MGAMSLELGKMPIGSKKNSGAAMYARGKQDLQGMAMAEDAIEPSSLRK